MIFTVYLKRVCGMLPWEFLRECFLSTNYAHPYFVSAMKIVEAF